MIEFVRRHSCFSEALETFCRRKFGSAIFCSVGKVHNQCHPIQRFALRLLTNALEWNSRRRQPGSGKWGRDGACRHARLYGQQVHRRFGDVLLWCDGHSRSGLPSSLGGRWRLPGAECPPPVLGRGAAWHLRRHPLWPPAVSNISATGNIDYAIIGPTVKVSPRLEQLGKFLYSEGSETATMVSGERVSDLRSDSSLNAASRHWAKG